MTHETYLSMFNDHGGPPIYPYLLLGNVWFIYFTNATNYSLLLTDLWLIYNT